ncbi:MAG TPA: DUF1549 domain-containing protein, partial [Planctomycetota bacterium]|nr:DUF1549 domain-containing protein [Planctomycetota bacterium]
MVRGIRFAGVFGLALSIAASHVFAADYAVPDKAKALDAVKALVADAAKSGKKVYVWVTLGTYVKAQLSQADALAITVISEGNDFPIKWDKIPQEQIPTIIKNCWQDDSKRALVGMDYCMATGQLDKAEEFMTLAAGDSKALGDDLKVRIKALGGLQDAAKIAADPQLAARAAAVAAAANKDKDDASYKGPEKIAYRPSEYGYLNPIKDVAAAVDNVIEISLAEQGIRPEPICDDTTFLRRVSLDLTGEIPSTDEVLAFMKDGNSNKRAKWIEEMSKRPEYADHWATFWGVLLVGRRTREEADVKPHYFRSWLRERFATNEKWDKIVQEILTATGENDKDGASNYLTFHMNDTLPITVGHISQTFLGARIACAQCHDHPFDKWTQQDFWGFSAFLANTRSERKELRDDPKDPMKITRQWHVLVDTDQRNGGQKYDPPQPELKLPPKVLDGPVFTGVAVKPGDARRDAKRGKDNKDMANDKKMDKPKDMASNDMKSKDMKKSDKEPSMSGSMDMAAMMSMDDSSMMNAAASGSGNAGLLMRKAFAAWVTSPKNEKFNQSAVNRIWRNLFGYGLVEPVDDIRPKNPPVYPEVMKILSEDFNASGRDLQRLVAIIANTKAYQRSSIGTLQKVDRVKQVRNFARAEVRPMTPEEFFMAVIKATAGDETAKHMEDQIRKRDANSGYGGMMTDNGGTPPPAGKGGKGAMAMGMGMGGGDLGEYTRLMERFIGTSTAE